MKLGIIGLPSSGKSTIFDGLAWEGSSATRSLGGRVDVRFATVPVANTSLDQLVSFLGSPKIVPATITFSDLGSWQTEDGEAKGISGPVLNHLAGMDGLVIVVRSFESNRVAHPLGQIDVARDYESILTDLILSDLSVVERRYAKLSDGIAKKAVSNLAVAQAELEMFGRVLEALSDGKPAKSLELSADQLFTLRNYGLLTLKPAMLIVNASVDQHGIELPPTVGHEVGFVVLGRLELDLLELDDEDRQIFMDEYQVESLIREKVIYSAYELMGLITFFTFNDKEVTAWPIARGASALVAADTIHSDIARGFIQCEVATVDQLVEHGSLPAMRSKGLIGREGRDYTIRDGDILTIKFNI